MLSYVSLASVRRYWAVVIVGGLLGGVVAYVLSAMMTPLYRSTAAIYVTLNFGRSASELAQGSTYTSNQMLSFGELATSPVVLDPVISRLGLDTTAKDLAQNVSVATPRDTVIMQISAIDTSSQRAADIANAVADQAGKVIEEYAPEKENGVSSVHVRVIARATPPRFQYSPDKRLNTGAGGLIGGLLGILATFVLTAIGTRVRNAGSLADLPSVPYLGSLSWRPGGSRAIAASRDPGGRAAREYRQVAGEVLASTAGREPLVLVVSAPTPGNDVATIATNLAAVLAETGRRVLLVDTAPRPLRRTAVQPGVSRTGLRELLTGAVRLADVVHPLANTGADMLVAGPPSRWTAEELTNPPVTAALRTARDEYDIVLVVTAPVLDAAETLPLTKLTDGVVMVVHSGSTTKHELEEAVDSVRGVGSTVVGVVISGVARRAVGKVAKQQPVADLPATPTGTDVMGDPEPAPESGEPPSAPSADEPPSAPSPDGPPSAPSPDEPPSAPTPDEPPSAPSPDEPPSSVSEEPLFAIDPGKPRHRAPDEDGPRPSGRNRRRRARRLESQPN